MKIECGAYTRLRERLREERVNQKMTHRALAQRLGCSRSCISLWEGGQRQPQAAALFNWAEALGVSLCPTTKAESGRGFELPVEGQLELPLDWPRLGGPPSSTNIGAATFEWI